MKKNDFKVCAAAVCHKGLVREKNQDNLYFDSKYLPLDHEGTEKVLTYDFKTEEHIWLGVFDGMGGERDGELASYIAVSNFAGMLDEVSVTEEGLSAFYNQLNQTVCEVAKTRRISQMGTTASVAYFDANTICISNLGDSPIYLFQDRKLTMVSELHNNAKLLRANHIDRKPGLTQFLGLNYEGMLLEPSVKNIPLEQHNILLICSDGLTDMLSEDEITLVLEKSMSPKEKVEELLQLTLEKGAVDNVTIILCEVDLECKKGFKQWVEKFKDNRGRRNG